MIQVRGENRMGSIPTLYGGCLFRSRLEANWAAFFDLLGIRWLYEPPELEAKEARGHIPDLSLIFPRGRILASVKPYYNFDELQKFGSEKLWKVGWDGEWLVLGAAAPVPDTSDDNCAIGLVSSRTGPEKDAADWGHAWLGTCPNLTASPHFSIQHGHADHACLSCGWNPGRLNGWTGRVNARNSVENVWRAAGQAVMWRRPQTGRPMNPFADRLPGPTWDSQGRPRWDLM